MRKVLLVVCSILGVIGLIIFIRITCSVEAKTCISGIGGFIVAGAFWKLGLFIEDKISKGTAKSIDKGIVQLVFNMGRAMIWMIICIAIFGISAMLFMLILGGRDVFPY